MRVKLCVVLRTDVNSKWPYILSFFRLLIEFKSSDLLSSMKEINILYINSFSPPLNYWADNFTIFSVSTL